METAMASTTAAEISVDPVSSLRAAALSTLKAKRRQPPPDRPLNLALPTRPVPPQTDTLDYGAEDAPQDDTPVLPISPLPKTTQQHPSPGQHAREEGEISDEDEQLPVVKPSPVKSPLSRTTPTPKSVPSEPAQTLEADRLRQHVPLRKATPPLVASPSLPVIFESPLAMSPLGSDHVRPGVQLTQNQYDTVKVIILDLLGWGVPPAFLIDCGLSREVVFYVFSELNLALPEGFDVSGIPPFMPEFLPQPQRSRVMPPPASINSNKAQRPKHSVPPPSPSKTSTFSHISFPVDLHDIERQRRQELLARKAAQASRKLKHSSSIGSSNDSSPAKDVSMTPVGGSEAVDDFLNSIGPVIDHRTKSISSDDMDIQASAASYSHVRKISSSSESRSTPVGDSASTIGSTEVPISHNKLAPPSSSSTTPDPQAILEAQQFPSRRGTKRAVATDFDFDPASHKFLPSIKQPRTAFVTIASRRCVIDLSDSEGEGSHSLGPDYPITKDRKGKSSRNSVKPSTPVGNAPPSALMQKEIEIQQMRELIARREEETRLKKLAAKIAPLSISSSDDNIVQCQPVRLKMEDTDVAMADTVEAELVARRSSESASPPAEISEASLPVNRSVTRSPLVNSFMQSDQDFASTSQAIQVQPVLNTKSSPFMFPMVDVDLLPSSSAQFDKDLQLSSAPLATHDDRPTILSEAVATFPIPNDSVQSLDYTDYTSPFDLYPLLRGHPSVSDLSFLHTSFKPDSHSSFAQAAHSWVPDLKPLRLAVLSKRLDPSKRLCQYESGGGTCRDDKCGDLHLSSIAGSLEPTDGDIANFLFSVLPRDWLSTYQVHSPARILDALQQVQQQHSSDDRVIHSLEAETGLASSFGDQHIWFCTALYIEIISKRNI